MSGTDIFLVAQRVNKCNEQLKISTSTYSSMRSNTAVIAVCDLDLADSAEGALFMMYGS